jgi:excisionase family DNA binding protein
MKLLRPDEVALRLNISRRQAYRLIESGELVALRVRCSLRVVESSIDQYLKKQIELFAVESGLIDFDEK